MALKSNRHVALFSWNINGIQPFVPPSTPPITSFFKLVGQTQKAGQSGKDPYSNPLRAFLKRHHWPEVLFLQEIKISPSDQKTPAVLFTTVNTSLGKHDIPNSQTRYTVDVNLPRDKFNARGFGGKIYGVGTLVREDFASQYVSCTRHADWDLEGRVTIVELHAETSADHLRSKSAVDHAQTEEGARPLGPGQALALINVYAVNSTTNLHRSPDTGKATGTRHDHKLAFHRRLRDECLALEKRGFAVVVAGDLNIARGALDGWPNLRTHPRQHCLNREDFNSLLFGAEDNARAEAHLGSRFGHHDHSQNKKRQPDSGSVRLNERSSATIPESFDGVDFFRALHGKRRQYTYHPRSWESWGSRCDRVDLITSRSLHESGRITATGILDTPQERGTSDHVPLWVKILYPGAGAARG